MSATHVAATAGAADWQAVYETEVWPFVERPSRYIDHEINARHADWDAAAVRVALVFPDVYEIGITHLGLKILYRVLNDLPGVVAERCYSPWTDAEALLRRKDIPLCSLESCRPLSEFHILGFSLQYELCYTNLLAVLDLAGLPLRSAQRREQPGPLVVAGGNVYSPGPLEPFVDAFVPGDGEKVVAELAAWAAEQLGTTGRWTPSLDLLHSLVQTVPGVYAPDLYETRYAADAARRVHASAPARTNVPFPVRKNTVTDFNAAPLISDPIVPYTEAIHDRAQVEIMRGCVRGCRFCQAGMVTRPQREKCARRIETEVHAVLDGTGYEDVTLAALSAGDCAAITSVLAALLAPDALPATGTAVSLPSLRVDSFAPELADAIRRVRRTGFTFAPEAGSQRLRNVINKSLTADDILATVQGVVSAGWERIKIYFMLGLPTETMQDVEELVALIQALLDATPRRVHYTLSIATFIPKAFTPFQWAGFVDDATLAPRREFILHHLPRRRVKVNFHSYALSRLEAILARGDRALADVVEHAFNAGCRFDDWAERFDPEAWANAFVACRVDPQAYLEEIPRDCHLPWQVIDCGVTSEFLQREWERAHAGHSTPSCRNAACVQCGVQRWFACQGGAAE